MIRKHRRRAVKLAAVGAVLVLSGLQALPALASALEPVSVVKIVNFSCSVCRASEAQDDAIRSAVLATGGQFALAAMPLQQGQYARELMYYAARDVSPALERKVRESLYRGAQDMGLPFSDMAQVSVWLTQDLPDEKVDWSALGERAQSAAAPRDALVRALRLIVSSGAQKLPTYLVVKGGAIAALLDVDTATRTGSLVELRQSVIERINQLSKAELPATRANK